METFSSQIDKIIIFAEVQLTRSTSVICHTAILRLVTEFLKLIDSCL